MFATNSSQKPEPLETATIAVPEDSVVRNSNCDATYNRTGHNNAKLMGYIDEALQAAGCY
jgi:hypothetical protein